MIQMVLEGKDGRDVILLGLSRENTDRLHRGQPVKIGGAKLGQPCDIVLIAGETEFAIMSDLKASGLELPTDGHTTIKTCCAECAGKLGVPHDPLP